MFRFYLVALLAAATTASYAAATCAGADPSIASVTVKNVTQSAGLNNYNIEGTVTNLGGAGQAKDLLQSVDIYLGTEKLDAKSIPPLGPGQSATFDYTFQRSKDAGTGTTSLHFVLDEHSKGSDAGQDCNQGNDQNDVVF